MKTLALSTVCGLALLAVSTISTAQAGDLTAPIQGGRFSYSQIGDIKGEHPLEYDGIDGEYPLQYDGIDGEHPAAWDGIDGEMSMLVWWWLY